MWKNKDNKKILDECLKNNLKVFIEKPVFIKNEMFNKYLKFKNNIFIGPNLLSKYFAAKKNNFEENH